jgi:hypothetical protein
VQKRAPAKKKKNDKKRKDDEKKRRDDERRKIEEEEAAADAARILCKLAKECAAVTPEKSTPEEQSRDVGNGCSTSQWLASVLNVEKSIVEVLGEGGEECRKDICKGCNQCKLCAPQHCEGTLDHLAMTAEQMNPLNVLAFAVEWVQKQC